jgi:hypothetical protein
MSAAKETIGRAISAIGPHEAENDWRLDPSQHASALPSDADGLARILRGPAARRLMARFTEADGRAVRHERSYKRYGALSLILNTVAIMIGAFAIVGRSAMEQLAGGSDWIQTWAPVVTVVEYAMVVGALIAAQIIIRMRPFEKWMRARGEAEISPMEFFRSVLDAEERLLPGEIPLLPLQLEYYRRYQLDMQLSYYLGRGEKHEIAASKRAARREVYAFISALSVSPLAVLFLGWLDPEIGGAIRGLVQRGDTALLGMPVVQELTFLSGMLAAALINAQTSISLLSQDQRNAARYTASFDNLSFLKREYLDSARDAAASGDREGVASFIDAAEEQISTELQEWIDLYQESEQPDFAGIARHKLPRLTPRRLRDSL